MTLRPAHRLFLVLLLLGLLDAALAMDLMHARRQHDSSLPILRVTTAALGLSDLCVATEARYTRHPAASDRMAPKMDHPGAMEHFPTGSFWAPPPAIDPTATMDHADTNP